MRSPIRQFYDKLYYDFEIRIDGLVRNIRIRRKVRNIKFNRDFYDFYKTKVRPFWAKYGIRAKLHWYKYYCDVNGTLDHRFIPDDLHYRYMVPHFDDMAYVRTLEDKNLYSLLFPNTKLPTTVLRYLDGQYSRDDYSPISLEDALTRFADGEEYVLKPTVYTGQGVGLQFFSGSVGQEELRKILSQHSTHDYVIQKAVAQHPELAEFNPSSLNTMRIVTLVLHGKPHILSSILRVGHTGSKVDNLAQGGYSAEIRPDGTLVPLAYTHRDNKNAYVECSSTGKPFAGFTIPSWDNLKTTVLDLAMRLPHMKLIGWDIAVDEHGDIVLIEFNCQFGPDQENCGPMYGDMTDEVLKEVFGSPKTSESFPRHPHNTKGALYAH